MLGKVTWFIVIAIAFVCSAPAGVAQSKAKYQELPNFHQVNENLYRAAQPRRGGMQRLAQLGIKTIVNLRDDDKRSHAEEQEAHSAGLSYFNVPMDRLGRPSAEKVERVLKIINARKNQPVIIHCKRGADRTGTIIAIYRIEYDGWTSEQAKAEAKARGMRFWQLGMKNYIRAYYQQR